MSPLSPLSVAALALLFLTPTSNAAAQISRCPARAPLIAEGGN